MLEQRFENGEPIHGRGRQKLVARELGDLSLEIIEVLRFRFFGGEKVERVGVPLQKLCNERGFADAPPSVNNDEGGAGCRILFFQSLQLF